MSDTNKRRLVNNIGKLVMVTYNKNLIAFDVVGILQKTTLHYGIYFENTTGLCSANVVFDIENINLIEPIYTKKWKLRIELS